MYEDNEVLSEVAKGIEESVIMLEKVLLENEMLRTKVMEAQEKDVVVNDKKGDTRFSVLVLEVAQTGKVNEGGHGGSRGDVGWVRKVNKVNEV